MRRLLLTSGMLLLLTGLAQAGWRIEARPTGPMRHARARHAAAALADGRVLVTGGLEVRMLPLPGLFVLRPAEVFDPARNAFTPTAGAMASPRWDHVAIELPDGRVLIAGGRIDFARNTGQATDSTEIYDPTTDSFRPGPKMGTPRAQFTATVLPDGRVLLAGGTLAEVFDPATDTIDHYIRLRQRRTGHGAERLSDGRVLLVGGSGQAAATAEVVDVAKGVSTMLALTLQPGVDDLGLVVMADDEALVLAGKRGRTVQHVQAFYPWQDRSVAVRPGAIPIEGGVGDMETAAWGSLVLIAGGETDWGRRDTIIDRARLLHGPTATVLAEGPMTRPRDDMVSVELAPTAQGWPRLLLAGGLRPDEVLGELPQRDAEILTLIPTPDLPAPARLARSGLGRVTLTGGR